MPNLATADPSDPAELVRVEQVMGTAVSFHVRAPLPAPGAVEAAIASLHQVDRRFSVHHRDSEVSRLARGELSPDDCHPDVRHVLRICEDLRVASDGAFDVRGHRPDGSLDPSAFVKGWSIDEVGTLLLAAGARNFYVNAGGDVLARGEAAPGRPWRVGIRHPERGDRVVAVLAVRDLAVATSGLYERGPHVRDARSGAVPRELVSVTVIGPELGLADAFATTILAMGRAGLGWIARRPGYGICAVTDDGRLTWTEGVESLLA